MLHKNLLQASLGVVMLITMSSGCDDVLLGPAVENTVLNNYDVFVEEFQYRYGGFPVLGIDWAAIAADRREILAQNPTDQGLYEALTDLIDALDDSHVFLSPQEPAPFEEYEGGIYGRLERAGFKDFDKERILAEEIEVIKNIDDIIFYGTIHDSVGYLYMGGMADDLDGYRNFLDQLMLDMAHTVGMVVDIRDNSGGSDEASRLIASYFADARYRYMVSRYKTGPEPGDFEEPREWYVEPVNDEPYLRPVSLLTNRYSVSAAETFAFAMKKFPHVLQVGDTTTGAFSDVVARQLPNTWIYGVSVGDYRNGEDVSIERIGHVPDILIENTAEDLAASRDPMLDAAIEALFE
ncbi:MAG: S41 family peptidase [Bacteroidota bacterium]